MIGPLSHPLISVIVPCYNYGHLVLETLENLKQQTYKNWECIIVNDGSNDNTEEIVLNYIHDDCRYIYIYQQNQGLSAARNTGIRLAKGDFIQLLDADDLLEPQKFAKQSALLHQHNDVEIVYGNVKYFYSDAANVYYRTVTAKQVEWMPKISGKGRPIISALLKENIMAVNCPLIKKEAFQKAGVFNINYPVLEDWEMWLRCAYHNLSFHYLEAKNTDALVRMHNISMSRNEWKMKYKELEIKSNIYTSNSDETLQDDIAIGKNNVCLSLLRIVANDIIAGHFKQAYRRYRLIKPHCSFSEIIKLGFDKKLKNRRY